MVIDLAVGVMAVAVVALVAFLIPMFIQVRKTAEETERLLQRMNEDLPVLFREALQAAQSMNLVATDMREGVAGIRVLGEAMGEIGQAVNRVNGLVRGGTGALAMNLSGLLAGFRAAYEVLKQRSQSHHQGGHTNGG